MMMMMATPTENFMSTLDSPVLFYAYTTIIPIASRFASVTASSYLLTITVCASKCVRPFLCVGMCVFLCLVFSFSLSPAVSLPLSSTLTLRMSPSRAISISKLYLSKISGYQSYQSVSK